MKSTNRSSQNWQRAIRTTDHQQAIATTAVTVTSTDRIHTSLTASGSEPAEPLSSTVQAA
jgi:hypothetical protein